MTKKTIKTTKVPPKGIVTLTDGKQYELAPLTANMMIDLEDKFDKSMNELLTPPISIKTFRALLYARIHPNYPEITEEQLGELVTLEVLSHLADMLGV